MREATAHPPIHKPSNRSALWLAALLIAGFSAATAAHAADKTYISPLHNFSVPVPQGIGMQVQENGGDSGGSVSFYNDFGNLKGIFYLRLSPEAVQMQQHSATKQRSIMESFLNDYAMPYLFRRVSPDASLLHTEYINRKGYQACFAIVDIPRGSTMFDAKAKRRYDTRRGLLIFIRGQFIYMLSSGEHPGVLDLGQPAKPLNELIDSELTALALFKSSIVFQ